MPKTVAVAFPVALPVDPILKIALAFLCPLPDVRATGNATSNAGNAQQKFTSLVASIRCKQIYVKMRYCEVVQLNPSQVLVRSEVCLRIVFEFYSDRGTIERMSNQLKFVLYSFCDVFGGHAKQQQI